MEVQAYVRIDSEDLGEFQFVLVYGVIDEDIIEDGTNERFEFTFAITQLYLVC